MLLTYPYCVIPAEAGIHFDFSIHLILHNQDGLKIPASQSLAYMRSQAEPGNEKLFRTEREERIQHGFLLSQE